MSAFMCSEHHLTALATYAVRNGLSGIVEVLGRERPAIELIEQTYRLLATSNRDSLDARYPNDPGVALGQVDVAATQVTFPAMHIIKACDCYAYQSCGHTGWEASRAKALIERIQDHALRSLPDYRDAPWGLDR